MIREKELAYCSDEMLLSDLFSVENLQIREAFELSAAELVEKLHIDETKALQIKGATELALRLDELSKREKVIFNSPSTIAAYMMNRMRFKKKEEFWLLLLDTKHGLSDELMISIGSVSSCHVDVFEVYSAALKNDCKTICVVHNPSGNPKFSIEDIELTKRLKTAGEILGIRLLDHLVIGDGTYRSYKEQFE